MAASARAPFPVSDEAMLLRDEPLAPVTSLKIGGPAQWLLLPACEGDVRAGIEFAARSALPWRVLGSGTNLLVPDEGLGGLTIKFWKQFSKISVDGTTIRAQAGATFWSVCRAAAEAGLSGIEFGCGIPGTVGGAVYMNAGTREREIRELLRGAKVLRPGGRTALLSTADLELGYRSSALQGSRDVVLEIELSLRRGRRESIIEEMNRLLCQRRQNQPINQPNCGSVFRNPPGDWAGRLIEAAGCKGMSAGGARVSELHANFIVNTGGATAGDVLKLIERVRERVFERFGMQLELELRIFE